MSYIGHGSLQKILSFFFITIYNKKKMFIGFIKHSIQTEMIVFFPFL